MCRLLLKQKNFFLGFNNKRHTVYLLQPYTCYHNLHKKLTAPNGHSFTIMRNIAAK